MRCIVTAITWPEIHD